MEAKNQNNDYIIKGKLLEKEEEIEELKLKDKMKDEMIANISDQLIIINSKIKELET